MRSWIRAGLIGTGVYVLFTLLGWVIYFVPMETASVILYALCIPYLIIGLGVGLLAALWLNPPRTIQRAGASGALAGLLSIVVSSCIAFVLLAVFSVATGIPQRYNQQAALTGGSQWLSNPVMQIAIYACGAVICLVIFPLLGWLGGIIGHALGKKTGS